MLPVEISADRNSHWIKLNHQCRIPKRWVAFDTESQVTMQLGTEIQRWRIGAAVRWRRDLKTGDHAERSYFADAEDLWQWVTDYCRPGVRTVVIAHNLGHDVRIADVFNILPRLGWVLEWCNLDRNVSSMTWRSDKGTLVLCDLWTWLPMPLNAIAPHSGIRKMPMPNNKSSVWRWADYCLNDAEIVYEAMSELLDYIETENLGNWQPTGAGMAYATWRHKFMSHKVLVHDDADALAAERAAMHTGRAEAWRHGKLTGDVWTEVDMRNAYVTIAAECELPTKLKYRTGRLTNAQYRKLRATYSILCRVHIDTKLPVVPYYTGAKTIWPIGKFETWIWDNEVDLALESGATVTIRDAYVYTRAPILQDWANWILSLTSPRNESVSPIVRTWAKHCGRALIGRISLRAPRWELYGANPEGDTGITILMDGDTGKEHRLMHVGDRTLIESARVEGKDSLPQVTGWIVAECRVRLWRALDAAGTANVAHVDTDGLLLSRRGVGALRAAEGARFERRWALKASYRKLTVYGPRNFRCGNVRKVAGVPKKATEILPNVFTGERWAALATNLADGYADAVTVEPGTWHITKPDPRRLHIGGPAGETEAYQLCVSGTSAESLSSSSGSGA